jgi:sec-independent protein translocase protein TatB
MLDVGWSELLVIGVVALIVVGPKDLPILFRRMGEFTGRMRSMAREFTSAMNQAADEAGMTQMRRDLQDIANPRDLGIDAMRSAARDFTTGLGDAPVPVPPAATPAAPGSTPPAAAPAGTSAGTPTGTPAGTPSGTPAGGPAAAPAGDAAAAAYAATGAASAAATGAAPAPANPAASHPVGPRPQAASQDDSQA